MAKRIAACSASSLSVAAIAGETYARATGRIRTSLCALVILVSEGSVLPPRFEEFRSVTQAVMRANAAL